MNAAVVFIEPNAFASRLHVLEPLVAGADLAGRTAQVILPKRVPGVDLDAFMSTLPPSAEVTHVRLKAEARPRERIRSRSLIRMLRVSRPLCSPDSTVVLTSPDDYITRLFWVLPLARLILRVRDLRIVRYRVTDVLSPSSQLDMRQRLKKIYFGSLTRLLGIRTILFDERIPQSTSVEVLPDPWSGPFGNLSRSEARAKLGWTEDAYIVGLIGKQDRRKGFPTAVAALTDQSLDKGKLEVALVGKIEPELEKFFDSLSSNFGSSLHHYAEYLDDKQLSEIFSACDVILVPYDRRFTSTSGVLVRAAASGTPVIASSHGLVGWRTEKYQLGQTFRYDDASALTSIISRRTVSGYQFESAREYADHSTNGALARRFSASLDRTGNPLRPPA